MSDQLQLRSFESLGSLENIRPDWNQLLSQIPGATIFNTWEWLVPWWRAFGCGQDLLIVAAYNSQKELIGLAPLSLGFLEVSKAVRLRLLRLLGDGSGESDNLDLLVLPGYEERFTRALLAYLISRHGHWDLCDFNTMPGDCPSANNLLQRLDELGWAHIVDREHCSIISLPDSWESYLNQISKKERSKIGYYLRRIEKRYHANFYRCTQEKELPNCLENFFRLHQKHWHESGKPGSFNSSARRQFYYEMASMFIARHWLEFWLLELDGKTVAAQFTFRYRDTVFALQEGFDPAYSKDSVGYALRAYAIRQLVSEGVRRYDFLGGKDPSKERWGACSGVYRRIRFARPFSRGSTYLRLVRGAHTSKEFLRAHVPHPAFNLLRQLGHRFRNVETEKELLRD
jgi:CelD/BcsL family acetyltransferase involved in cellulose biosynthesis